MQPFAQFRLWLREGPLAERRAAGAAIAIAVVLSLLALVPVTGQQPDVLTGLPAGNQGVLDPAAPAGAGGQAAVGPGAAAGGAAAGAAVPGGAAGGSAAPGAAAGPAAGSGGAATGGGTAGAAGGGAGQVAAGAACGDLAATAPGVSAKEVKVAFAIVELAGAVGAATFDIRQDGPEMVAALVDHINKSGGVACGRKLVAKAYKVNPTDSNDQQAKCLQMIQDGNLMAVNVASYVTPVSLQCFVRNRMPLLNPLAMSIQQARESYPYMISTVASIEQMMRNGAYGLAARKFFARPQFKKVGVLQDNCVPAANNELRAGLKKSGIKDDEIFTYTIDCTLTAAQNQLGQAVLQMKASGATHALLTGSVLNMRNFVKLAASQDYRPKYGFTDKGSTSAGAGADGWDDAFNGAVGITGTHGGEINAGVRNAEVKACDKILTSHGLRGMENEQEDGSAAIYCDTALLLDRMLDRVGKAPTRTNVLPSLIGMGVVKTAVTGDSIWDRQGEVTGGDFQRAITWTIGCRCFKIVDRAFGRSY